MTQKRGLGRGLGALIPGAGSSAAPEQELRTRSTTRARSADEEQSASDRPVDMFFSGESVSDQEERAQRERPPRQDIAGAMARAAAERRGRSGSSRAPSGKQGTAESVTSPAGPAPEEAETASPSTASGRKTTSTRGSSAAPAKGSASTSGSKRRAASSRTTKSGSAKTAATKTPAAKTTPAKTSTTKSAPAKETASTAPPSSGSPKTPSTRASTAKTAAPKTTSPAKSSPSQPAEPKAPAAKPADTKAPAEDSPIVDVESVELTPAQRRVQEAAKSMEAAETTSSVGEDAAAPSENIPADAEQTPAETEHPPVQTADPVTDPEPTTPEPTATSQNEPVGNSQEDGQDSSGTSAAPREGLLPVPGAEFADIPIHEIRENPRNPRTMFDEDELDELASSVRQVGVLQPVVVRPIPVTEDGESFELVMGERRWRAARRADLSHIPSIIRETNDDDLLRDALLENLHRTQLNPLEEAAAYQQLLDDFGCTQDELSERIGRSRPQITNTLRLLRLPALVQRRLASGALSAGHARALLGLDDPALMEELAQRIVSEGLSVRAVERLVAGGSQPATTRTPRRSTYDPHVVDLTSRLSNRLETQVRIDVGKRKGRITLEFTNLEDLERLVENIGLEGATEQVDEIGQ